MKRLLKWISICVLVAVFIPVITFGIYGLTVFVPNIDEINSIIETTHPENKNPPAIVKALIKVSTHSEASPSWAVARNLVFKFRTNDKGHVPNWQLQWASWYLLTELFYDDDEIFSLFCALIYNGEGYGLNEISLRLFNAPLSDLTDIQAAEVVAYSTAPSRYSKNPERLVRIRDHLLQKVRDKGI